MRASTTPKCPFDDAVISGVSLCGPAVTSACRPLLSSFSTVGISAAAIALDNAYPGR